MTKRYKDADAVHAHKSSGLGGEITAAT